MEGKNLKIYGLPFPHATVLKVLEAAAWFCICLLVLVGR